MGGGAGALIKIDHLVSASVVAGAGAGQLGGVATPSHQLPVTVTVSIEQPTAWAEAEEGED